MPPKHSLAANVVMKLEDLKPGISLVGIDLITVEARIVVASIDTYLKYADAVGLTGLVSRPQLGPGEEEEVTTVETIRRPVETTRRRARRPPVRP